MSDAASDFSVKLVQLRKQVKKKYVKENIRIATIGKVLTNLSLRAALKFKVHYLFSQSTLNRSAAILITD